MRRRETIAIVAGATLSARVAIVFALATDPVRSGFVATARADEVTE